VRNESNQKDDRELIARCREGDDSAFEELVGKYQQQIVNLVYHYIGNRGDVEDIAQKIFIKVYFSIPKFDIQRPFVPWLYRISINQCYDELRHLRRRKTYTFSELSLEDSESIEKLIARGEDSSNPEESRSDMHDLLQRMLDQLSDSHRQVIVLRDIEGVPYNEIAAILKCSEQAARLKVFRARNRLKKIVEKSLNK
jgi:RNA polymerase sigma-70 factor (ECF subfamily)